MKLTVKVSEALKQIDRSTCDDKLINFAFMNKAEENYIEIGLGENCLQNNYN